MIILHITSNQNYDYPFTEDNKTNRQLPSILPRENQMLKNKATWYFFTEPSNQIMQFDHVLDSK